MLWTFFIEQYTDGGHIYKQFRVFRMTFYGRDIFWCNILFVTFWCNVWVTLWHFIYKSCAHSCTDRKTSQFLFCFGNTSQAYKKLCGLIKKLLFSPEIKKSFTFPGMSHLRCNKACLYLYHSITPLVFPLHRNTVSQPMLANLERIYSREYFPRRWSAQPQGPLRFPLLFSSQDNALFRNTSHQICSHIIILVWHLVLDVFCLTKGKTTRE